jgi:nucleotide-binding universal stress UspA family protein
VTSEVLRDCQIPVLVIPPNTVFKEIKKVALACHKDHLMTDKVVQTILEFTTLFQIEFHIIDIVRENTTPTSEVNAEAEKIKNHFETLHPQIHIIPDEKVVHGVNEFADKNDIDVVIMISHKHSFFERLFTEIHTDHMSKATHRPFLEIPQGA